MNTIILAVGICILISILVLIILLIRRGSRESSTGVVSQLGPYRNLVLLSDKGGMARVYRAYNIESDRDCVLKVLRSDQLGDADAVKKFIREAEILEKIKKTSPDAPVVSIYKSGTITTAMVELPFIEMEYIPGNMDLSDYLKQKGRMQPEVAEKVVVQIIRALVASHDVGEVHRDLKPGNVLLYDGDPEKVVVCDFGVAKQVDSKSVTMGGYGTAAYMSPEQCRTGSRITPASDIYSLGVVFYELITGKPVFSDDNPFVVMKRHQEEDPASLVSKKIPEAFISLLSGMLHKDPAKRPVLNDILAKLSIRAIQVSGYRSIEIVPVTMSYRAKGFSRKKLLVGALTGLLLVLSGALGVIYYNLVAGSVVQSSTSVSNKIVSKTVKKTISLPRPAEFGALYLTSTPAGAKIIIDGKIEGKTPLEVRKVYAGKHQMLIKMKYYQDVSKEILIKKDIVTKEHLKLKRGRGNITVLTTPAGAFVYLNDRKQEGKSPMTIASVKAGQHKILIHKDAYYDKKVSVEIPPDFTEKLEVTLDGGNLVFFRNKWIEPEKRTIIINKEKEEAERKRIEKERERKRVEAERKRIKKERERKRVEAERRRIEAEKKELLAFLQSLGKKFVYIKPGTFMMGSPSNEPERSSGERQHKVTLTRGFYMQTTEVTQGQWRAVMGNNPSYFKNCGDDCPVEKVSWNDAQGFISRLNQKVCSDKYRLPTEAEWEYATRAGSRTAFANGGISELQCGYDANLDAMGWYCGNSNQRTHPVAQKQPNALGLYDMHGNVWEWCQDWYGYSLSSVIDPTGPSSGSSRVRRGGCWSSNAGGCRSANRFGREPGLRSSYLGFRLALSPGQ